MESQANPSRIKTKSFKNELRVKENQSKLFTEFDDFKSQRSAKSQRSHREQINIEILGPKDEVRNPEESYISRKSELREPSFMDKSFASSRQTRREKSQVEGDVARSSRKMAESRQDFSKKMTKVDSLNEKINERLNLIEGRF